MEKHWKHCEVFVGGGVNFPFLAYCWAFYNEIDGVYPIKGLTLNAMAKACAYVEENNGLEEETGFDWGGGDTEDRCNACRVLIRQNPDLKNPYETEAD